ncbi:PTS glucose transporter subunit IIA [Alteromonadaceae bacterium M269]|nr:PTS glucose transporter subunit IIA [Alteromonadaceae bacterium M269]
MGLFSKLVTGENIPEHKAAVPIISPLNGKILPLDQYPCPIFKERLMGEGVALEPAGYQVFSPFDGLVEFYPRTSHQIRLKSKQGVKLLIQFGFESDRLMGEGFRLKTKEGAKVSRGDLLLEFDLPKLKQKLNSHLFAVTILNSQKLKGILPQRQQVMAMQDLLMTLYV